MMRAMLNGEIPYPPIAKTMDFLILEAGQGRVRLIRADVSTGAGARSAVDQAVAAFGRLDGLINNAGGMVRRVPYAEVSEQDYDEIMDLNARSVVVASQAAIALTNRLLISQLEELFESFINLINLAIDEKSHYTGGHCQRVPSLTMLLAEAVAETTEGPLASFTMDDRDRYELKIAGLLHDCGKITTPVHVVDKATKLQTLFDRIELIDTRFEVLKRDAEIDALRQQLALRDQRDAAAEARFAAEGREKIRQLDADRQVIRAANRGSEAMKDADIAQVRHIGTHHTWRNVDGVETEFLTANELENLTIRAGTLTQGERNTINHHIVATIKMLEQLPWPKHLKNVPEYAGGHHERMDGKGYPKGLTRDQMSVQARVMGIADIFEALTASDRPYKPGMKLSQAVSIMKNFKAIGHIDPDLFDIFIWEKVYEEYAQKFLEPHLIDEIDLDKVPGYSPIPADY